MTREEQKEFMKEQIRFLFNQEIELHKRRVEIGTKLEQMEEEDILKRARGETNEQH